MVFDWLEDQERHFSTGLLVAALFITLTVVAGCSSSERLGDRPAEKEKTAKTRVDSMQYISFSTEALTPVSKERQSITWKSADGDRVSLAKESGKPPAPFGSDEIEKLREHYRKKAEEEKFGIVSVDALTVDGVDCQKIIIKIPQQQYAGMDYRGILNFPFPDFSYVVSVTCKESGIRGLRERIILENLKTSGKLKYDSKTGQLEGWEFYPYDKEKTQEVMFTRADDEKFDDQFPDHPLSRLRRRLNSLINTIEFSPVLRSPKVPHEKEQAHQVN